MNLLAIESSTECASIALAAHGEIYCAAKKGASSHASSLLSMIDDLLVCAELPLLDIHGIVFGRGPGSFTGLRVACGIAKGMGLALNLPLYPVSTLDAMIESVYSSEHFSSHMGVLSVIDARMQQMYWRYKTDDGDVGPEIVSDVEEITLPVSGSQYCLVGVGWKLYEERFSLDVLAKVSKRLVIYPEAKIMLQMVQRGLVASVTASEALPVYIRDHVVS